MTKKESTKYLIIGNSAGGIGAAEAIRQVDKAGTITIVSDEPYPAYSRPLISEYLAGRYPLERMLFRPPDFYEKHNIQTILGKKAEQLNTDTHTIKLKDRGTITWEKLLLATGGLPIVPRIEGIGLKGVFTFTTLDDAKAIDESLNRYPKRKVRAVVIGGGLIGVSVTKALRKRGVEVTIIEMKERVLNTILDEEASVMMEEAIRKAGVNIMTGHTVAGVDGDLTRDIATGVTLDDGRKIPCDLVIVAIGVQPHIALVSDTRIKVKRGTVADRHMATSNPTELVSDTKIKVKRGIVVDRHMATSNPDVYACGDVAEAYDFICEENRLTPIWPHAYLGGRIAGLNMAGVPTKYRGGTAMNSLNYFGAAIVSAGMVNPPDDSYEVISLKHDHIYKKVILKDGLIVGMLFGGDIEKSGIVYNLMKDRVKVEAFKQALVADDFGLVSLPEEIWRPQLEMPPSIVEQPEEIGAGE